jgi:hypothetical protein
MSENTNKVVDDPKAVDKPIEDHTDVEETEDEADSFINDKEYLRKINGNVKDMTNEIDLSKIKIVAKDKDSCKRDLADAVSRGEPTYNVPCIASGYSAQMTSLNYSDILALLSNDGLSPFEYRNTLYHLVYDKIKEFSPIEWQTEKPTFEQWSKATALCDVDTLLYGIYHCTYQDKSVIKYVCQYCKHESSNTIVNSSIVRTDINKNVPIMAKLIEQEGNTTAGLVKLSKVLMTGDHIHNLTGVVLPRTKMIFFLKLPTVADQLAFIHQYQSQTASMTGELILCYQMTECIGIPSSNPTSSANECSLLTGREDIMNALTGLTVDDMMVLRKKAQDIYANWNVPYGAKDIKCEHCGHTLPFIPMSMEDLLFTPIYVSQSA